MFSERLQMVKMAIKTIFQASLTLSEIDEESKGANELCETLHRLFSDGLVTTISLQDIFRYIFTNFSQFPLNKTFSIDKSDLKSKVKQLQNFESHDSSIIKYTLNEKILIDLVDLFSLIPKEKFYNERVNDLFFMDEEVLFLKSLVSPLSTINFKFKEITNMDEDEIVVTSTRKKKKEKKIKTEKNEKKKEKKIKTEKKTTDTTNSSTSEDLTPTSATSESSNASFKQSLPNTPIVAIPDNIEKTFSPIVETIISVTNLSQRKILKENPVDLLDGFSSSILNETNIHSQNAHLSTVGSDTGENLRISEQYDPKKIEEATLGSTELDRKEISIHDTNQEYLNDEQIQDGIEEQEKTEEKYVEKEIESISATAPEENRTKNELTIGLKQEESTESLSSQIDILIKSEEHLLQESVHPENPIIQSQDVLSKPIDIAFPLENPYEIVTPEDTIPKDDLLSTPPPRFSSSLRDNTELRENMRQILCVLMNHKYASHFNSPVNEKLAEFRDYSKFIKKPMDLSIIKANFEKSHYNYIDEFIRDVQSVFTNSFMFHLESSPQVKMAKVLQDIFEKELDKVLPYWRAFELSPKIETNDSFSDNTDSENSIIAAMESYFIEGTSRAATPELLHVSEMHLDDCVESKINSEEVLEKISAGEKAKHSAQTTVGETDSEQHTRTLEVFENVVEQEPPIVRTPLGNELPATEQPKVELTIAKNRAQLPDNVAASLNRVDLEVDSLLNSESADSDTLSEFEEDATEIEDAAEENHPSSQQENLIIADFNRNIELAHRLLTASEMYSFFKSYIHPLLKSEDLLISMKAKKDRYENILERMQYSDRRDVIIEDTLPHSTSLLDVSILAEKVRYREDRLKLKEIQISNKCEIQEQIYKKKEREVIDQKSKLEAELESKHLDLSNKQTEFENRIAQIQQEIEALKQSLEQTRGHLKSKESENEILKQELEQARELLGSKDREIELLISKTLTNNITVEKEQQTNPIERANEADDFVIVEKTVPSSVIMKSTNSSTMDNDILEQNNDEPLTEDGSDVISCINEMDYQLILEEDEQAKNAQKLDQTKQIQLQGDKCPCGREIWKDYGFMRKPRFCNYTNKYYCTKCHSNTCTEVIPAKILSNWDFKPYKVCDEASKYLKSVHKQPIICVSAVKPTLFDEIQNLGAARMIRKRLIIQWEYVSRCPMKDNLIKQYKLQHRLHYLTDTEMYSIKNLEELNMKQVDSTFLKKLSKLFHILSEHIINQCGLCQTKAKNLCACCATGPIYDFNISQVIKCQNCKLVFHKGCFTNGKGIVACPICSVDN